MQLLVLGMHRSGTSTVARLLNMMGAYCAPSTLIMPANSDNEKGFWERWDVFGLHEDILRDLGLAWDRLAEFDALQLQDTALFEKFKPQAEKILLDLDAQRPWLLKDPRLNILLPLWENLLEVPICIYVHRNPIQVAQSIQKREGFSLQLGLALWEYYTLQGLANSAKMPRILLSYHDLIHNPVATTQLLHEQLVALDADGLRLPSVREINAFIEPRLHHQQGDDLLLEAYANPLQLRLNQAFQEGAVFNLTPLPSLSGGAWELLHAHSMQFNTTQKHQTTLEALEQKHQTTVEALEQKHQTELKSQEQKHQTTVEALEQKHQTTVEALEQHHQALNQRLVHLRKRRQLSLNILQHRRRTQIRQQQRIDHYQAHWYAAEKRIIELEHTLETHEEHIPVLTQELEQRQIRLQALEETVNGLHYQVDLERHAKDKLFHWTSALAHDIHAIFASMTWRAGSQMTRLALALLLRKPEAGARGQIERILQEIEAWRHTELSGSHSAAVPPLPGTHSEAHTTAADNKPERYAGFTPLTLPNAQTYKKWYLQHRCQAAELEQQRQAVQDWNHTPLISLTVPCYNSPPRWLDELLTSIHRQTYPGWECILVDDASPQHEHLAVITRWCQQDSRFRLITHEHNQGVGSASQTGLEAALGDYFTIIDHDDILEPNALYEVAHAILTSHADVIYSDELLIRDNGAVIRCEFRPQFSYHFLLSHPYIVHLTVFRREILFHVGGYDRALQVSQDYDLLLRVAAQSHDFHHIPKVLYQWRTHSNSTGHTQMAKVTKNSLAALERHLRLAGFATHEAQAVEGASFNFFRTRYYIRPCIVSVIIPTRDRVDLLKTCIESLLNKTRLPSGVNIELIVVNNNSEQAETLAYFAALEQRGQRVIDAPGIFNFSHLNNLAVAQAKGEFVLFLNNDIEIIEPEWLEAMLELMAWNDVGAVGAKLLYPDIGLIQHAGVIIAYNGIAAHDHQFYPEYEHGRLAPGHNHALLVVRECMAVTAACMLVRREAFNKVNGFDTDLQVGFGDTDLCLRLRQIGYRTLFTPYARLIHHESASRGYHDTHPVDTKLYQTRWKDLLAAGDPYYNPNLTLFGKMYEPRLNS
jgi:GT2 family glycosyltransferase